jgi:hypothetical protein
VRRSRVRTRSLPTGPTTPQRTRLAQAPACHRLDSGQRPPDVVGLQEVGNRRDESGEVARRSARNALRPGHAIVTASASATRVTRSGLEWERDFADLHLSQTRVLAELVMDSALDGPRGRQQAQSPSSRPSSPVAHATACMRPTTMPSWRTSTCRRADHCGRSVTPAVAIRLIVVHLRPR